MIRSKRKTERIIESSNRVNFPRIFVACLDNERGRLCVGWVVASLCVGLMEDKKCAVGPVWVRKGMRGEPLLAMRPEVAKWGASIGCSGFVTDSIRYDKQDRGRNSMRAYSAWVKKFGLRETGVRFEGEF